MFGYVEAVEILNSLDMRKILARDKEGSKIALAHMF